MICHIDKVKGKNHMIISIDTEKALDKIRPLMILNVNKIWINGNVHILIKDIYKKIYSHGERRNFIPTD